MKRSLDLPVYAFSIIYLFFYFLSRKSAYEYYQGTELTIIYVSNYFLGISAFTFFHGVCITTLLKISRHSKNWVLRIYQVCTFGLFLKVVSFYPIFLGGFPRRYYSFTNFSLEQWIKEDLTTTLVFFALGELCFLLWVVGPKENLANRALSRNPDT